MMIVKRFVLFSLLLIIRKTAVQCQDEEEKRKDDAGPENDSSLNLNQNGAHTIRTYQTASNQPKRPQFSNIGDDIKDILNEEAYERLSSYFIRYRRQAPDRSIVSIRKRLNEEKKRDEVMPADANPRMEPNETRIGKHSFAGTEYGVNTEQLQNKKFDIIRELRRHHPSEDKKVYESETDCEFETDCLWTWRKDIANGFFRTWGKNFGANETGPRTDANNKEFGNFLLLRLPMKATEFHVTSPLFKPTISSCKLAIWIYQEQMEGGEIRIVGDKTSDHSQSINNHTQWLVKGIPGDNSKKWKKYDMSVGKISRNFTIILEVVPSEKIVNGATVAFDNIQLIHCYQRSDDSCTPLQYKCKSTKTCINSTRICDIKPDCQFGDDEQQNCDLMPYGSRCTFEDDWCGWQNIDIKTLEWTRHNGSTPTNFTGPNYDHTYMNTTGNYLYVSMLKKNADFASTAVLRSVDFNPPPRVHGNTSSRFYNSCAIRFYLHKTGKHKSGILLQVTELTPAENISKEILWSFHDHGDQWVRQDIILPNITHRYFVHFEARKGMRYMSDIAIDDVSLSPECFGLNIPPEELNGYNYWNPLVGYLDKRETHPDFKNKTYYEITTCNIKGRFGPKQYDCAKAYNGSKMNIKVLNEPGLSGVQKWVVPQDGFYTIILSGASGGKGGSQMGSSRGAQVRTIVELKKGQEIFMLVGQEGTSSCVKSLGYQANSSCHSGQNWGTGIRWVLTMDINDGGGGGGGGTYVFMRNRTKEKIPLAVAGGGGGLGLGRFSVDSVRQHGQGVNISRPPLPGKMYGAKSAGAGGGWSVFPGLLELAIMGSSLQAGGAGGKACYESTDNRGDGGFGGGGGGCRYGGGGGGFAGGNAPFVNSTNGEGGYSYLNPSKALLELSNVEPGVNAGPGYVLIIPSIDGCECDYRCLALDARRSQVTCICPQRWKLGDDKKKCVPVGDVTPVGTYPTWFVVGLIVTVFFLTVLFGVVCFLLYNRYQQKAFGRLGRKMIPNADLQLDRLRITSDSIMEYNPNYEFGGVVYTLKDLKDIPREQLRLVKALGQGAFGEVYQGFYRQRPCDTVEMPVAVKTLPEMSTSQAEMDFLMEALIMSKFNHPNIVHFIGVCFDKHPRFIVLELLAGGDLKNFLRESRPKPERASPLTMKDLVLIAVDVAKGCKYLEDNRFIHRDIAARNCLLTTKGPGRCVKIADFGMSRDVYRSDYYRKGGKAMLPIKWMPPEAFLDGLFTSKTDVWSFGVLLWEIMSMGYMPYTGCANREVMQLVTSGGRLDPPANCPGPIYGIMTQCWHPAPEQRPTFATILERLGYCVQDPQVMNAPLPVFQRPPSNERDTTVMRPTSSEENCLQVDKLLAIDNTPNPKISPISLPNNVLSHSNHNNNMKGDYSLKSGVSLDAGALAKQVMTPSQNKKYANINTGDSITSNGVLQNDPFSNHVGNSKKYLNEAEINC
ncbi:ALK tyrosine kinase receptor isoform X2 [Anoplophora glabripennis]|uniref:ALK tyrosine kinase receptor isoform X2 n=1 Tax=Anoplophora glabripennis TaxID=217634 RepID=UPI0008740D5B|nr:ALK tyrosine kinase receptor isoform X2 [Anoplophora glabripennis]